MVAVGSTNLFLARDTKVFLEQGGNIWEIPVLEGYSFSQSTNTSEVTLAEMSDTAGNSRRGKKVFTDSYAPAEWSFDTYVRPYIDTALVRAVEEPLWANFVANNSFTPGTPDSWAAGVTIAASDEQFDLNDSNKILLGTFNLYFVLGANTLSGKNYTASGDTTIYRINDACVNEVSINFDIDGISTLSWSGFGGLREEVDAFDATAAISTGIDQTNNFIRNRLTALNAVSSVSGSSKTYILPLTGGSITLSNNISYLTPAELGKVNQPLGHVTGTRSISGSFTAYLDEQTNGTIDLLEDIQSATTAVTNKFALDFYVGGKAAGDAPIGPGMQFKMPQAHLSVPDIDTSDVIAVNVDFTALPSNLGATDELTYIKYVGV